MVTDDWQTFDRHPKAALVLNGDSAHLPLPDASVDAVVTDPPYFDLP
jgi:putative DNA methylase